MDTAASHINRDIYNTYYTAEHLRIAPQTAYDRALVRMRFAALERYGTGKDVLDLCCGTGSYLIPMLGRLRSAVGVDVSEKMLAGFWAALGDAAPAHLRIFEADAATLPLDDASIDFVWSFASLYYVPNVAGALQEVGRVLRPGGYAALELGNLHSIATMICHVFHRHRGWARPYHIPYRTMLALLRDAGLDIVEARAFQTLPMFGVPRRYWFLAPMTSARWKSLLGISVRGRMLDDWMGSSWPLRYIAFRHWFLVRKTCAST